MTRINEQRKILKDYIELRSTYANSNGNNLIVEQLDNLISATVKEITKK